MARRTIFVSDLSGEEIPDGKGATVTITFKDTRKGVIVLDLTDLEAEKLGAQGRRQAKRGRRRGGGSKPIQGVGTGVAT